MEQHVGLGHGARIVSLDVWWPATNTRQQFSNVDKDEFIAIKEFDTGYTKLDRQTVHLGGSKVIGAASYNLKLCSAGGFARSVVLAQPGATGHMQFSSSGGKASANL